MRLGFVVKPLARPELRSHDSRRWQNHPHLSVEPRLPPGCLHLPARRASACRISSDLAPSATHPDMPQFHPQVGSAPPSWSAVHSPLRRSPALLPPFPTRRPELPRSRPGRHSAADLVVQATILDRWTSAPRPSSSRTWAASTAIGRRSRRYVAAYEALPEAARRRLALENDESRFGVVDTLWVHERTGILWSSTTSTTG